MSERAYQKWHLKFLSLLFIFNLLGLFIFDNELIADKKSLDSKGKDIQTPSIMVTATRVLEDLFELPLTVNVITAEDIKREPATNITDILASIPGVIVVDPGLAGAKRVSIRGEDVGRTLVLINGIKTVDKRAGQTSILIDPSQIERIEVIKGPASVLYGPEAIGGVINIITKKGGDKPVGFSQNFVLDSSSNSLDVQSAIFGSKNGFNYRFSGSGVNAHDRKVPGGYSANRSSYKNRYYSGQVGYDWDEGSFTVRADRYESELFYATGSAIMPTNTMKMPENDRQSFSGTLELRNLSDYFVKFTMTGSFQNTKRNMLSDFKGLGYLGQVKSDQDQYGLSAQSEWSLGSHYLVVGVDYDYDDVHVENITHFYRPRPHNYSWADVEQSTLGVFVQDEWTISDPLKLTLGLRQTWVEGKFKDKFGSAYAVPPKKKKTHNSLVGSIGAVYTGFEGLALRAQWSQGNRYPSISQLFTGQAGHGGGVVTTLPNPDLDPESSNSYEIGARYNQNGWDLDASLFYTKAKDFIDTQPIKNTRTNIYYNAAKAETIGAEMSLAYTFDELGFTPYTNASWLRRTNTLKSGYKTTKTQVPPFQGRVGVKWQGDLNSHQRLFTNLYLDWATEAEKQNSANEEATKYPAWQTLNFTIGVEGGEDHKYNASLSLRNIGNQHYVTSRGSANLPEPGFHVVLGLGFEY